MTDTQRPYDTTHQHTEDTSPYTTTEHNGQPSENKSPEASVQEEQCDQSIEEAVLETAPSTDTEMQQRLAQAETQIAEYKDQWLRATADYKNYKRRAEAERAELIRSANAGLILKLLPVLDDFERAIENIPADIAETPWWGGTQLIAHKFRTILESEGVTPIEALDQDFDPNVHEAVMYEEAAGQDNKVVAVLQKGYKLRDRVIRPTMVKVGKD